MPRFNKGDLIRVTRVDTHMEERHVSLGDAALVTACDEWELGLTWFNPAISAGPDVGWNPAYEGFQLAEAAEVSDV